MIYHVTIGFKQIDIEADRIGVYVDRFEFMKGETVVANYNRSEVSGITYTNIIQHEMD